MNKYYLVSALVSKGNTQGHRALLVSAIDKDSALGFAVQSFMRGDYVLESIEVVQQATINNLFANLTEVKSDQVVVNKEAPSEVIANIAFLIDGSYNTRQRILSTALARKDQGYGEFIDEPLETYEKRRDHTLAQAFRVYAEATKQGWHS